MLNGIYKLRTKVTYTDGLYIYIDKIKQTM